MTQNNFKSKIKELLKNNIITFTSPADENFYKMNKDPLNDIIKIHNNYIILLKENFSTIEFFMNRIYTLEEEYSFKERYKNDKNCMLITRDKFIKDEDAPDTIYNILKTLSSELPEFFPEFVYEDDYFLIFKYKNCTKLYNNAKSIDDNINILKQNLKYTKQIINIIDKIENIFINNPFGFGVNFKFDVFGIDENDNIILCYLPQIGLFPILMNHTIHWNDGLNNIVNINLSYKNIFNLYKNDELIQKLWNDELLNFESSIVNNDLLIFDTLGLI